MPAVVPRVGALTRRALTLLIVAACMGVPAIALAQARQSTTVKMSYSQPVPAGRPWTFGVSVHAVDSKSAGGGVVTLKNNGKLIGSKQIPPNDNFVDIDVKLPWGDQSVVAAYSGNATSEPSQKTYTVKVEPHRVAVFMEANGCVKGVPRDISSCPPVVEGKPAKLTYVMHAIGRYYSPPMPPEPTGTVRFSMYGRPNELFPEAFGPEDIGESAFNDWVASIETTKLRARRDGHHGTGCYEVIGEFSGDQYFAPESHFVQVCPYGDVYAPEPTPTPTPLLPKLPPPSALPTLSPQIAIPAFGGDDLVEEGTMSARMPLRLISSGLVLTAAGLALVLRPQ